MPIPTPEFDSRDYRSIVTEALARIPVHNPEWTNQLDSDPGVTLLQVFAFMTESIIYRANLIPERNRRKYLNLLGIPMRQAAPATGLVAFTKPQGSPTATTVEASSEVRAGAVPFRTENGLAVLPVEARLYYKSRLSDERRAEIEDVYRRLYASWETSRQSLDFYETKTFAPPTSGVTVPVLDLANDTHDGMAWLALLTREGSEDTPDDARRAIANQVLTLGILPGLDEDGAVLHPPGDVAGERSGSLVYEVPNTATDAPVYTALSAVMEHDPLARPGVVQLALGDEDSLTYWDALDPLEAGTGSYPPALEDDDAARLITWIRIRPRPSAGSGEEDGTQLKVALGWIGINAAAVVQRTRVAAERLPDGTGEPDQVATLVHTPVIADTVTLTVNGERWREIDDLAAAPPEVPPRSPRMAGGAVATGDADPASKVYQIDLEAGEIRFGDGANGMRPPAGSVLQASYDHGGGREGVVGIGAINRIAGLATNLTVTNPAPTWGGAAAETVDEAEARIPATLRHRNRLVSSEDFEEITRGTPGVELGRVDVLACFDPGLPDQTADGAVTVMVIPTRDARHPTAPRPDRLLLETICGHLEPRRLVTTEIHVRGPDYRSLWVSAGIDVVAGHDLAVVRDAVATRLREFLSPLVGGHEEEGWPLGKAVEALEVLAAATRVDGVAKVGELLLAGPDGAAVDRLEMTGLQLPSLQAVAVASGEATSLDELLGEAETDDGDTGTTVVPVPVMPEEC